LKIKTRILGLCALLLVNTAASATGSLSVEEQIVLEAKPTEVWMAIGRFGGLHEWHPAAKGVALHGTGKQAGDTRIIDLGDGASITEVLVDHDDATMSYSYVITASPLPVAGYRSTLRVMADGAGTRVAWSSTFDANGASAADAEAAIAGVYTAGLGALQERFK